MSERWKNSSPFLLIPILVLIIPLLFVNWVEREATETFHTRLEQDFEVCRQRSIEDNISYLHCSESKKAVQVAYQSATDSQRQATNFLLFIIFGLTMGFTYSGFVLKHQIQELKRKIDV